MLDQIYQYSFLFSLLSLIGWFFVNQGGKLSSLLRIVFFGAIAFYLYSVIVAPATVNYKLGILFRDLLIISGLASGFSLLRKNPRAFVLMLVGTLAIYQLYFKNQLAQTFSTDPIIQLDKNGELLMALKSGSDIGELADIQSKYGLSFNRAFSPVSDDITDLDDYWVVNIPPEFEGDRHDIVLEIRNSSLVDHVEENELINVSPIVAEPARKSPTNKYDLNDPGVTQLWSFDKMQMDKYYQLIRSKKVAPAQVAKVFILDTGVDGKHEDIVKNYVSTNTKYDKDGMGHGTHCACIAGAVSNNGKGIASVALDQSFIQISSVKVLNNFGGGTQKTIIDGMIEAADNGADVISMSLGGLSGDETQKAFEEAVAYANDKGAIVVVSAGNSNQNATEYAPANIDGVITVSAIDQSVGKASFSNYVQDVKRGIGAPGVDIYSCVPRNRYNTYSGTSMAAPYVAGLVGVLKSIQPDLDTDQVYDILHSTGQPTKDGDRTGPLIQPAKAVSKLVNKLQ